MGIDYSAIQEAISKSGYRSFGVRAHDEARKVGQYFNLSVDGCEYSDTYGKKLDGTSAIGLMGNINRFSDIDEIKEAVEKALQIVARYGGEHISLVGGSTGEYGDDDSEVVIGNPTFQRRRGARMLYAFK